MVEIKRPIDFKFILQNSPHFCVVQESASGQTKSLAERSRLKKILSVRETLTLALYAPRSPPPKKKPFLGEDRLFCSLQCTAFLSYSSVY